MKSGFVFSRFFIALIGTIDIKLSLKITNFRTSDVACARKILHVLQEMISSKFPGYLLMSLRKNVLCRKVLLDSTSFCMTTALRGSHSPSLQDSTCSFGSQMNLTLSFRDRSALASLSCKYSAEASRVRICSSSNSDSGGVAMLSAES